MVWSKIQLTGMQIGTIYAGNAIFSMVLQPFYGYLSDKIGMKRYLLFFIVILVALTGPFFVFVYEPLLKNNFYVGAVIGSFVLSLAYYAGVAVIESFIEKMWSYL
ncbi:LacY proton/sugar symporter [Megamonas hypermegale ART12/1]|nr:LacY proton/sugar symporter [Megamonas hypermegale ART12/1]